MTAAHDVVVRVRTCVVVTTVMLSATIIEAA